VTQLRFVRYRVSRRLGRILTRTAALLTLGRMPPFVSSSAIVVVRNRILVIIDPILDEPTLPGGHLKWAEKTEAAVIREVHEETGYTVVPIRLVGVFAGQEWTREPGVVRLVYEADITGGSLVSSSEGRAVWTRLEELVRSDSRDAQIVQSSLDRST
jgi:ADP-ribose pyrophosphatase YjhB (NUDIX family)